MSAFRDAIAQGVLNGMDDWAGEADWQNFAANAVIDTPEMRAIRQALFLMARLIAAEWKCDGPADALGRGYDLPEHVIDWVLS